MLLLVSAEFFQNQLFKKKKTFRNRVPNGLDPDQERSVSRSKLLAKGSSRQETLPLAANKLKEGVESKIFQSGSTMKIASQPG